MKKVTTALAAAGLLALGACGGGSDTSAANNGVEEVNLFSDDLTATDGVDANAAGNDANASFGAEAGNLPDANGANSADAGNAVANSSGNSR